MKKQYWFLTLLCLCLVIAMTNNATLLSSTHLLTPQSRTEQEATAMAQAEQSAAIELFPFQEVKGGRSGYIDRTGKETIRLKDSYFIPRPFSEGLAAVRIAKESDSDPKLGYINTKGNLVIQPKFLDSDGDESEEAKTFSEGLAAVAVIGKSGFYEHGYIDKTGKVVIPFQYGDVRPFRQGLAWVSLTDDEGRWKQTFFINKKGKRVFQHPELYGAADFSEGLAVVRIGEKSGYIDTTGKLAIQPQFIRAGSFYEGLAPAAVLIGKCELKWGYINRTGKFVIEPQFGDAEEFSEGLAAAMVGDVDREFGRILNGKWGYIDRTGKFVIQPQFEDGVLNPQDRRFSEGLAPIAVKNPKAGLNGLVGFIDRTGRWVIKPSLNWTHGFSGGLAWSDVMYEVAEASSFPYRGGKHGYIDRTGKFIWESKYDS